MFSRISSRSSLFLLLLFLIVLPFLIFITLFILILVILILILIIRHFLPKSFEPFLFWRSLANHHPHYAPYRSNGYHE